MSLTRPDLDAIPSYVPGRTVPGAIKLASNEVPYGPLPGVPEAIAEAVSLSHRYPDLAAVALREKLGARLGVDPARIATGCGSVALTEHLARATCVQPGDEILYAWRSFEAYPIIAQSTGATSVRVPNRGDHGHDLTAMAAALTPRTRLAFVCNPNNPTGTAVRKAELDAFVDAVPDTTLVVLDEAYHEFVTDPGVPDGLATYGDRPNVVVLRTFSKAWGMAAERERVQAAIQKLLPEVPDSQSNFVWLPLRDKANEFAAGCERQRVIVRPFQGDGVRVTIGTPDENDAFLAAAEEALS